MSCTTSGTTHAYRRHWTEGDTVLFSECNSAVTPPLIAAVGVCSCSAGPPRRNMQAFVKLKHHCPWCFPGYMTLGECYIKKKEVSNPYVYLDPNRVS